jgi:OmpA-OmpF porin, OOP family
MSTKKMLLPVALALAVFGSLEASAQSSGGYATSTPGAVWKSPYGLCWRSSFWTREMATAECDPDLVPKPAAAPAPAPTPAPAAPPPPPQAQAPVAPPPPPKPAAPAKPAALTLGANELFGFGQATLTPAGRKKLDTEVVERSKREYSEVRSINVNGHTDRLGSALYNQQLSERRADAVRGYLVSRGFDRSKIETYGYGKTMPAKSCPDQKSRPALIECLAPNRRVEIEINGTRR